MQYQTNSPTDRFISCANALDMVPKTGTLFEYSQRLLGVAHGFYPDGLPRLIDGKVTMLVKVKEGSMQLTLI